jgi:ABC-type transport system involved in cytochrome c biogenesis ATPase subunit
LLILDEPKQQNLDADSLLSSVDLFENTIDSNGQVILTTYSESKTDRDNMEKYFCYEMTHKKDYLIKRIIQ